MSEIISNASGEPAAHQDNSPSESTSALQLLEEEALRLRDEISQFREHIAQANKHLAVNTACPSAVANEHLLQALLQAQDIAESAANNLERLTVSSQRDSLTGTPNRALMLDRLTSATALATRRKSKIAVLFLDLDHFKMINDTWGHQLGDEVLQLLAQRIKRTLRTTDSVSRFGGDEFLVLLTEVSHASDAINIAEKILSAVRRPSSLDHANGLSLSVSVGIATFPEDGTDPATLITHADEAMYRAKAAGGGRYKTHQHASD